MEIKDNVIKLDRELNTLDKFVLDFTKALSNHKYVIVSGYVSILFGRSRSTEDIDLVIEPLSEKELVKLFDELISAGFECINTESENAYEYISKDTALRFARKGEVLPNMEVKFGKTPASIAALNNRISVEMKQGEIFISPIELQIAYKRLCLCSQKDLEDARHLEIIFEGKLSKEKLKNYEHLINQHGC